MEWLLVIALIVWLVLTFFYKQAIDEFRMNQMEWPTVPSITTWTSPLTDLLSERIPLVLRSIPQTRAWSREDVRLREDYRHLPLFKETTLTEWISSAPCETACPWAQQYDMAERIAAVTGVPVWFQSSGLYGTFLHQPFLRAWLGRPIYGAWAGEVGMHKTTAIWTLLMPIDGVVTVSILPQTMETKLPAGWRGRFPAALTRRDTPFVDDLRFMDIRLRPGTMLVMPPHWIIAWSAQTESADGIPMMCTVEFHSPISRWASR